MPVAVRNDSDNVSLEFISSSLALASASLHLRTMEVNLSSDTTRFKHLSVSKLDKERQWIHIFEIFFKKIFYLDNITGCVLILYSLVEKCTFVQLYILGYPIILVTRLETCSLIIQAIFKNNETWVLPEAVAKRAYGISRNVSTVPWHHSTTFCVNLSLF